MRLSHLAPVILALVWLAGAGCSLNPRGELPSAGDEADDSFAGEPEGIDPGDEANAEEPAPPAAGPGDSDGLVGGDDEAIVDEDDDRFPEDPAAEVPASGDDSAAEPEPTNAGAAPVDAGDGGARDGDSDAGPQDGGDGREPVPADGGHDAGVTDAGP
jgi:hypothetical protein